MFGGMGHELSGRLIALVITFLVFLLLREVACWYWKINKLLEVQTEQLSVLKAIAVKLDVKVTEKTPPPSPQVP